MDREKFEYWFSVLMNELTSGNSPAVALVNATRDMAQVFDIGPPRCEHDVVEGDWCVECNRERKAEMRENGYL